VVRTVFKLEGVDKNLCCVYMLFNAVQENFEEDSRIPFFNLQYHRVLPDPVSSVNWLDSQLLSFYSSGLNYACP